MFAKLIEFFWNWDVSAILTKITHGYFVNKIEINFRINWQYCIGIWFIVATKRDKSFTSNF